MLIKELEDIHLRVQMVTEGFDPKARFSTLGLHLEITAEYISLKNLLRLETISDLDQFKVLSSVLTNLELDFPLPSEPETNVVKQLANKVLVHITDDMWLEEKYRNIPKMNPRIKFKHLGMGTSSTWHGTPDGRVRGFTQSESSLELIG